MSESDTNQTIDRQRQGSILIDTSARPWADTDSPGFLLKPIFKDEATGESTSLMKIEAGAYVPAHDHGQLEEIFVIAGDFYDEQNTYGPGDYCQRATGAPHTAGSKTGCTVLLIYRN